MSMSTAMTVLLNDFAVSRWYHWNGAVVSLRTGEKCGAR